LQQRNGPSQRAPLRATNAGVRSADRNQHRREGGAQVLQLRLRTVLEFSFKLTRVQEIPPTRREGWCPSTLRMAPYPPARTRGLLVLQLRLLRPL
jgi:hypothetical protein